MPWYEERRVWRIIVGREVRARAKAVDPGCNWSGPMHRGNRRVIVNVLEPGREGG